MKDAQPLEGKLKEFMDSATGDTTLHFDVMLIFSNAQYNMVVVMLMDSISEGAVLVSFGSALKPEQMPAEKIQVFVDTFKNLGMKVFR